MDNQDERPIPHNIVAEQALLGACLVNNDAIDVVMRTINPKHFFDPLHGRIFQRMVIQRAKGQAATPVILRSFFEHDEALAQIGGPSYLARLAGAAVTVFNVADYAGTVVQLADRRNLINMLDEARASTFDLDIALPDLTNNIELTLAAVNEARVDDGRSVSLGEAMAVMIDKVGEAYQSDGAMGAPFGIPDLDDLTGGMYSPELILLGGRPSMGKTALALHIARKVAEQGRGVFFASLEMDPWQLAQRIAAARLAERDMRVEYSRMRRGKISEDEMRETAMEAQAVADAKLPLIMSPPKVRQLGGIYSEARIAQRKLEQRGQKLDVIFVDFLQLIETGEKTIYERMHKAAHGLKALSTRMECPVVALAQLSRDVERRANLTWGSKLVLPQPQPSDLKGAGDIEEIADMILMVQRDEVYYKKVDRPKSGSTGKESQEIADFEDLKEASAGKMDVYVPKFRNGEQTKVQVDFDLPTNLIYEKTDFTQPDQGGFDV